MKKETIKEIIRDFHSRILPQSKGRDLSIPLDTGKIVTLSGVRRSGKTYLLYETIKKLIANKIPYEKIVYINLEDERLELKMDDLDLILQGYLELYPDYPLSDCYLFFDEIQNVDGWEKFVRRIYDTITKNIYLTGSNSKLLSKELATSLWGRTVTYEVFPLSFREYLRFNEVEVDLYNSRNKALTINLFEKFLLEGGFPEVVGVKDNSLKNRILQEYFDVMLYRDIIERFNITNLPILKYLIKRLFENITNPVSVNKIYNELKSQGYKVGKNYLYECLDAAESVYLFLIVKKYNEFVLRMELGEKKAYSIDTGLLNGVTFKFSKDYGKLLENVVLLELHKKNEKVFFYKGKKECDFIVLTESGDKAIIQTTYSLTDKDTREREIAGLVEACKKFNNKEGYIITISEEEELKEEGITIKVIPCYKYFTG